MNANGEKMILDKKLYDNYVKILENELVPALGCTEPIAIAYAANVRCPKSVANYADNDQKQKIRCIEYHRKHFLFPFPKIDITVLYRLISRPSTDNDIF